LDEEGKAPVDFVSILSIENLTGSDVIEQTASLKDSADGGRSFRVVFGSKEDNRTVR